MGAIHGKGRFKCDGCQHRFSWRLDLRDHIKTCKPQSFRSGGHQQQSEIYLLDVCFLCGQHLVGTHSEEASFIKGNQKLYHSNRPLAEVLEVITCDTSVTSQSNQTIALCKPCMNSVNKWDETHQQLQDIASSLRKTYRSWNQKRRNKLLASKYPEALREYNIVQEMSSKEVGVDEICEEMSFQNSPRFTDQANNESQYIEKSSENAVKEYTCGCGKVACSLDELVEHQLRKGCKAKTNEYPCSYCDSVFPERKLLIAHKKACVKKSLVNGAHECDICGRRFLLRGRVETHKRTVHGIGTADQQLCSYCGRTFSSCYNMNYHLAREHGIGRVKLAVTCNLCGKKFSEKSSYQSHVKSKHLDHRFECEHCGKKYATRGMRNHHINEMHNSSYSYKCSICGEQFKLIFRYRYHIRKMHSSVHHSCKDCGKTFIMSSDLYRHIRGVHMGIRDHKRYPCKVCGRMFPSMYKVKRHATSHGIIESKEKSSLELETKAEASLDLQVKPTEQVNPLMVHDDDFVTGSLIKGMTTNTLIQRKLGTITSSLSEAAGAAVTTGEPSIATSLSETHMESSDGTSIDVHQLPPTEIYTTPHITTLTPEILQGNMSADVVAAETMAVGAVSSIVVSASAVQECMNADDLQSVQQHQQLHQQNSLNLSHLRRGSTLIQPALQSSLVPMHQMIVFEEAAGQNAFSVRSSNQVISVSQCTNQVISGSQIPSQVICIPHSNSETSHTSHHSQTAFSVPLTQHHPQVLGQQKLPTIQYEHYTS